MTTRRANEAGVEDSRFASALRAVFAAVGESNETWARWLGVTPGAVSQWTHDACAPSPRHLYTITSILRDARENLDSRDALDSFQQVLSEGASEVTPNSGRVGLTLGHYMLRPLRESFLSALETLPIRAQEELILTGIQACRTLFGAPAEWFDLFAPVDVRRVEFRCELPASDSLPMIASPLAAEESTQDVSPDGLCGLLALIACETPAIATRLDDNRPTSPSAARSALWSLGGCEKLATALEDEARAEPVLGWAEQAATSPGGRKVFLEQLTTRVEQLLRTHAAHYALESELVRALDSSTRNNQMEEATFLVVAVAVEDHRNLRQILSTSGVECKSSPPASSRRAGIWCDRFPRRVSGLLPSKPCEVIASHGALDEWFTSALPPERTMIRLSRCSSADAVEQVAAPMVQSLRAASDPWAVLRDQGPLLLAHMVGALPSRVAVKPNLVKTLTKTLAFRFGAELSP